MRCRANDDRLRGQEYDAIVHSESYAVVSYNCHAECSQPVACSRNTRGSSATRDLKPTTLIGFGCAMHRAGFVLKKARGRANATGRT